MLARARLALALVLSLSFAVPATAKVNRRRKKPPAKVANKERKRAVDVSADATETIAGEPDAALPLPERLAQILLSARGKPTAIGHVIDLKTSEVVFSLNADKAIYPASVSKMFATASAIRALPNKPLVTQVLARGKGPNVSTLAIVGSGDPSLTTADLGKLASKVAAAGIRSVKQLWVDTTIFDDQLPAGYDEKQTDASYRAPVAGLQVDSGAVTVVLKAQKIGQKPLVELRPAGAGFTVVNEAVMVKGRGKPMVVKISGTDRKTQVLVQGSFGIRRKRIATRRRVHDAGYVAGHAFAAALAEKGVQVGVVKFGPAPGGLKAIASHRSRPVVELLRVCNQTSHNGFAESFYKLVGATKIGRPGSSAKGEQAAKQVLGDLGVDFSKLRLRNGSGLYHANQVTAKQVVALLAGMHKLKKVGKVWRGTLAIAGAAGTLRARLRGPATRRRIYGKTGTLDDVTALAGYAESADRRYAFALFFNDVKGPAWRYRKVHDRFLQTLLEPASATTKESKR